MFHIGEAANEGGYLTSTSASFLAISAGGINQDTNILTEILESLDPDMAELMHEDEEAARLKANDDEEEIEDDETETVVIEEFD